MDYVEGAFPPLIDPEQWNRCNMIMDHNCEARHQKGFQPLKKYDHVFGGRLRCCECGATFHANKDRPRDNGFFPTTYRCGARMKTRHCQAKGITDVKLGPFIFNYISNLVRASKLRGQIRTPEELEQILLSGPEFKNVAGLDPESLSNTFAALRGRPADGTLYIPAPTDQKKTAAGSADLQGLRDDLQKNERALDRLKKIFLFADDAMDEKEYLATKRELEEKVIHIKNKIIHIEEETTFQAVDEMSFIKSASSFLVSYKIQSGDHIVYSDFAATIDDKTLKDFIGMTIEWIWIKDGKVSSIQFRNGLENVFLYRS